MRGSNPRRSTNVEFKMKIIYRITIQFTEPKLKDVPPTNLFITADDSNSKEEFLEYAESLFKDAQAKSGLSGATYKSEIRQVSEEEVEEYKKNMASGNTEHRLVN